MGLFKKNNTGLACSLHTNDNMQVGCNVNETIKSIKVLGGDMCPACKIMYANVQEAVKNLQLDICVEYITDVNAILKYDVITIPSLVVNEKVVTTGTVLNVKTLETLFSKV